MEIDEARMEVLSEQECLKLLESVAVGRVVYTVRALPAVQPVNFVVDSGGVVFRTGEGTKFALAVRGAIVAFEADEFDLENRTGWDVTVTGHAREIHDPQEVARLRRVLRPWAPGVKEHFIRIAPEIVTGRRLVRPAVEAPAEER
ncbi:pyridoxamine 5'-phosphate oxidase [Carbonactinospora thermoautotrophica]|uniref:Pyridoxamine 5'-phosphate oxidase n=1 Tax=Carbonactinospora thermoautotrophica TaxID=1469144 RepID=A0A132N087_9ACTN|nr:pyridoxamine 5'-phosphate oxidase family protein [Carbonactinospora thermoautotrophica]KWX03340.1 pyridoxamine 5'-phosphate oxidase [Carbonactinospora thermoautotrophica]